MDYKRVLRLHYVNGFSSRAISESTKDGKTTINEFLKRFRESEVLSWPLSDDVTNEVIERLLYQKPGNITNDEYYRGFNEEEVHRKLAKKGETLLHLWKLYNAEGEVDGKGLSATGSIAGGMQTGWATRMSPSISSAIPESILNWITPVKRWSSTTAVIRTT